MSKKLISLLLTVCMLFCLCACGATETSSNSTNTPSESQTDTVQNTDEITSTESENIPVSSDTEESKENNNAQTQTPVSQSNPASTTNQPSHTHSYSNATCTSPKKCSCGVTAGTALGHQFSSATCTSPKICDRCGTTSGNALGHTFEKYVCTRCNFTDEEGIAVATNPKISFKPKIYYTNHYVDDHTIRSEQIAFNLYGTPICFGFSTCKSSGFTTYDIPLDSMVIDTDAGWGDPFYTIFNGTKYYYNGGLGYPAEELIYELTDAEIVVYSSAQVVLKFKMNIEGNLVVTYSEYDGTGHTPQFNEGDILW